MSSFTRSSEFDMDFERLTSGRFDANYLVCHPAAVAMNLLGLIGQNTLNEPDAPLRQAANRRWIKTVMHQEGDAGDEGSRWRE